MIAILGAPHNLREAHAEKHATYDLSHFLMIMRRPWTALAAWEFVTALLASPGLAVLVPTHRHADIAGEFILELPHLAGNLLHYAHTAILMREHGIRRICTRDTDFHQFAFLEVIDPLRS